MLSEQNDAGRNGDGAAARGPLAGYRVLDFCQLAVGPLAAAWLGQLGADVIKVEVPAGDPIRKLDPRIGGIGTYYTFVNTSKRSVSLDLKDDANHARALELLGSADVVMSNFRPGVMARLGIDYETVRRINPGVIYASASGYGSRGPRSGEGGADGYTRMFTAFDTVNGYAGEQWQQFRNRGHVDHLCSACFLQGVLGALYVKARTGLGQQVETSMMQATIAFEWSPLAEYLTAGYNAQPRGSAGKWWLPDQAFAAKDGYLAVTVRNPEEWDRLVGVLVELGHPIPSPDDLASLRQTFLLQPVGEWVDRLQAAKVRCAPFLTLDQMVQHPQVTANDMVEMIQHRWGDVQLPTVPWSFSRTPASVRPAPHPRKDQAWAEHDAEQTVDAGPPGALTGEDPEGPNAVASPLNGIRVVEFPSDGIAVAVAGMQLGDLGALVVKLEAPAGDPLRQDAADGAHEAERRAAYREVNRNKHTRTCDLQRAEDREMATRLVAGADVLLIDLPDLALQGLGLDYGTLSPGNPGLIMVRSSYFGLRGPMGEASGSELAVQAISGLWECLGRHDDAPLRLGVESAETSGGAAMCQAVLAALIERQSSGKGQVVETSALGATLALMGQMIGAHSPGNSGGGWHLPAPGLPEAHPVPTADFAVDFSMPDGFAFTELYRNLGVPDELSEDPRFTDKLALILNWPEFEQEIGPYFLRHPAEAVKELAYTFGGILVIANTFESLVADPQLEAMNVLAHGVEGAETGKPIGVNPPWDFSLSRYAERREVTECAGPPTWESLGAAEAIR